METMTFIVLCQRLNSLKKVVVNKGLLLEPVICDIVIIKAILAALNSLLFCYLQFQNVQNKLNQPTANSINNVTVVQTNLDVTSLKLKLSAMQPYCNILYYCVGINGIKKLSKTWVKRQWTHLLVFRHSCYDDDQKRYVAFVETLMWQWFIVVKNLHFQPLWNVFLCCYSLLCCCYMMCTATTFTEVTILLGLIIIMVIQEHHILKWGKKKQKYFLFLFCESKWECACVCTGMCVCLLEANNATALTYIDLFKKTRATIHSNTIHMLLMSSNFSSKPTYLSNPQFFFQRTEMY